MSVENFTPIADTVNVASATNTSSIALSLGTPTGWGGGDLLISNGSDKKIHVKLGDASVGAAVATTDLPILAGAIMVVSIGGKTTHVTTITESGTATGNIYFTLGRGA